MATRLRFKEGEKVRIKSPVYPEYSFGKVKRFMISGKLQKRIPRKTFSAYLGASGKALSVEARQKGMPKGWHSTLLVAVEHVQKIPKLPHIRFKKRTRKG